MGRHSNLILVDDEGRIMDSAKRVTPAMSRARLVLPRLPYAPPPPQDRPDPRRATLSDMTRSLATLPQQPDPARALVAGFRGISPVMAREIVFRAAGHGCNAPDPAGLLTATREILSPLTTRAWSPRVYRERGDDPASLTPLPSELGEGGRGVRAFSPIPMAHLAAIYDEEPIASISAAAALAEADGGQPAPLRHAQRRQRLLDLVAAARTRAERRLAALTVQAARADAAERLKTWGDLIYAYLWQIAPEQHVLVVDGESIPLDPSLSGKENAQAYFERYRKARDASRQIPDLLTETQSELAYLEQLATLIAQAPGFAELEALAAEWTAQEAPRHGERSRRQHAPRRPSALADDAGNAVYVGRSGPQNELVTFDIAGPDDTWLHARGVGGSHVVIRWRSPRDSRSEATIEAAAALAAWYSAARESGSVEVDVAPRRYVRKLKGGRPGMVTYRNERTIRVAPRSEDALRDVLTAR